MEQPWVVIPTYNEKDNIEQLIRVLFELSVPNFHVLIVDDSSPDGTGDIVERLKEVFPFLHHLRREGKEGLGRAYIAGFQYALDHGASSIIQMDADFSHDPKDIPKLLAALSGHDMVIGSRYCKGISVINWPLKRLLVSIGGNVYASLVTGMPFKDVTGGFKAWRASTLSAIDLSSIGADGYGFQIEMNYRAWKRGTRITEVPIIFTERREGHSKMSNQIVWEALWIVWRLRFSH